MTIPEQIYGLVKRRPRNTTELIDAIWWIHPQDAPQRSAIKAHVWHANRVLKAKGERIVNEGGVYRVGSLERPRSRWWHWRRRISRQPLAKNI